MDKKPVTPVATPEAPRRGQWQATWVVSEKTEYGAKKKNVKSPSRAMQVDGKETRGWIGGGQRRQPPARPWPLMVALATALAMGP